MHDSNRGRVPGDFDALARQYWQAWGEQMRSAAPNAAPMGQQPWQAAMDGWSRMARGGTPAADDVVGRFNTQAQQWLGQMQQVAAQFAGRDAGASDIAGAWRRAMEGSGVDPFLDMFRRMQGPGIGGFEKWSGDVSPMLENLRGEAMSWLRMPAFGSSREKQERLQKLAQAQSELQQHTQAYNALMMQATQGAFVRFEHKLAEREEPGQQVRSARALFDLWIDAAEDAYAEIALSKEFRSAYGKLVNAQMRVRAGVQREVEDASASFGMPTRTELDGAHRKIVELERQMRRMRDAAATGPTQAKSARSNVVARGSQAAAGAKRTRRSASLKAAGEDAPAAGSVTKKTTLKKPAKKARPSPGKRASKKAAAKKAPARKSASKKAAGKRPSAARTTTASKRAPQSMFADTALPKVPGISGGEE